MDLLDLSRRLPLRALRRLANRYRRHLIAGVSLAAVTGATMVITAPAFAHDDVSLKPPLTACSATLPLTTPCSVDVTPPGEPGGPYLVTLLGVGTLTFTIDPTTNAVTTTTVSADTGFSASAVKVDGDGDKIAVTFTSATDPAQVYTLKVSVKPPAVAGGAPTVTAKVKGVHKEHDEQNEQNEHQHEHEGSGDHDNDND